VIAIGPAVVALVASALLLVAQTAAAMPTWLSPAKLSAPGENAERPQVAVDANGDAVSVWERFNGGSTVIEASSRPAGSGGWQAPVVLSSTDDQSSFPHVALDSEGDAVAVWEAFDGTEYSIQAATRPGLTGAWQGPVTLKLLGAKEESSPELAVDGKGDAVAIWQREEDNVEASSRPAGGPWQAPVALSENAAAQHSGQVAIDAAGNATAVWENVGGAETVIDASSRPANGSWAPPVQLSEAGASANEPRVAVDPAGDSVAVWERSGETEELIEAASRPASSGGWGKPVALTMPETGKGEPGNQQVAIDANGEAVVVWGRFNSARETIEASEGRPSSSTWQAPVVLSGPGRLVEELPQVAVNGRGSALVVWEQWNGTEDVVEGASGLASGPHWQAPVTLSLSGGEALEPQVALDAQNNAVAVWRRADEGDYAIEAAGYDAAGPLLHQLVVPASGTVGQSLSFSVSPLDTWSALGATSWSFGDGSGATGTSVAHVYAAPGAYTVTLTSDDVLGNATSTSAALAVSAQAPAAKGAILLAPRIDGARLTRPRFRVSPRSTAVSARAPAPRGTAFAFSLSEAASMRITFQRSVAGLRSGGRCLAPSPKLRRRHVRRCTRTLTLGALRRAGEPQGADVVAFSGRIGSRALTPGSYRAVLQASAAGLTSVPVTLSMKVVG